MYVVYSLPSQIGAHAQVAKSIFDNAGNVVSLKPSTHCATAKNRFCFCGEIHVRSRGHLEHMKLGRALEEETWLQI